MKKSTGKKPVKKQNTLNEPKLYDKKTIIVLVVSLLIFAGTLFWLYSDEILPDGASDMFSPYNSDELVEFEKAKVIEIVSEDIEYDEVIENAAKGQQELTVVVKSGRYKGETMTAYNYFGAYYGVPVEVGDGVTLTIKTHLDGVYNATVYEFNRIPILAGVIVLFFLVVIAVGGRTGLKSLIGLSFTMVCLFVILIPLILKGMQPIPATFIMCAYIALVCFTILGGVHRKTISAFLGTVSGTLFAMIFGLAVQHIAKIDGLRLDDAEALIDLKYYGANVYIRGIMVASIIICALGAVMDVSMSISSALEEVHAANPSFDRNQLFRSGMNIGRDMVGTMTNTLILAFLGSEFILMIFFYARDLTFYHMFSSAFIAIETISGISSSIGMVLAIPLTAFISSGLIFALSAATRSRAYPAS